MRHRYEKHCVTHEDYTSKTYGYFIDKKEVALRKDNLFIMQFVMTGLLRERCASVKCFHVDRNEVVLSLRKDLIE